MFLFFQVLDAYDTSFHGDNYLCLICKAKFGTALKAIYHFVYTHNHKYCSSTLAPIMKKAQKEEANPIVDPMKVWYLTIFISVFFPCQKIRDITKKFIERENILLSVPFYVHLFLVWLDQ